MKPQIIAVKNANDWAKKYTCKFIEPGLINYDDMGCGTILVRKEALDNMAPTIIGKPVLIKHDDVNKTNYTDKAVGYVSDVKYNDADGWYYCDFIVFDDEAKQYIEGNKWSVSCAYVPKDTTTVGGLHNNIRYEQEVLSGEYTHLALVDNPRYEDAKILLNSKQGGIMLEEIKKLLSQLSNSIAGLEKKNEVAEPKAEKKNEDGLTEILSAIKELTGKLEAHMGKEEKKADDSEIEAGGKDVEAEGDIEAAIPLEGKETPEEEELEKKNGKESFKKLKKVANERGEIHLDISTIESRIAKGAEMYGSRKVGK